MGMVVGVEWFVETFLATALAPTAPGTSGNAPPSSRRGAASALEGQSPRPPRRGPRRGDAATRAPSRCVDAPAWIQVPRRLASVASRHEQLPLADCKAIARRADGSSSGPPISSGHYAANKLRERIETFTEEEAAETHPLLDQHTDPLTVVLDNAPLDDDPVTEEEEAEAQVARDEIARGETISLDEIRAEFDAER